MGWLNKETLIGILTLVDTQKQVFTKFMEEYDDEALALAHTEILMKSIIALTKQDE